MRGSLCERGTGKSANAVAVIDKVGEKMNVTKRIIAWGALITAVTLFGACPANSLLTDLQAKVQEEKAGVPVSGVSLSPTSLTLLAGGATGSIVATIVPANATNKNVTWSSSASGIAYVSDGVVIPVAVGAAVITVTTADGNKTATCAVSVVSANKAITAFSIVSPVTATGTITGTNIAVSVPYGTIITAMVASFTGTGATVKVGSTLQVPGTTPNNFTNPVVYTVTALDGSSQNYTVTVNVALNPAKDLTAFGIVSPVTATGTITGTNIAVSVPYGTIITAMVASFTTTGATVKVGSTLQTSGSTSNNFTNPVVYTVTALDGTSKNYTVTVAPPPFRTYTTANGLGSNTTYSVAVSGSYVCLATYNGLAISTDGGNSWVNYNTVYGLPMNYINTVTALVTSSNQQIYAGTAMGLAISYNGGQQFTNHTVGTGYGNNVTSVALSGSTIYVGTLNGASYSTDGGNTWTNRTTANGLGSNTVEDIVVVGSTIYAATNAGVSISTDGGNTWTNHSNGIQSIGNGPVVTGVAVSGSTIYAATQAGVAVSTNGGSSFTNYTNGLGGVMVSNIAISGSTIYAACNGGLSVSTNLASGFMNYKLPNNALSDVVISGSTIYVSTQGGVSISP